MVSHPENGSDSPIGSNRDRGRDKVTFEIDYIVYLINFEKLDLPKVG